MQLPLDIASIKGFMPEDEGAALYRACAEALQDKRLRAASGLCVEIGTYCGKSAVYLGAACKEHGGRLVAVDHHRGSEDNQAGEAYHDPELADGAGGIDSLPFLRATLKKAQLEDVVVPLVAPSRLAAELIAAPLAFVFIDGGHSEAAAREDCALWAPKVAPRGVLAMHDIFADPKDGGQGPYRAYQALLESGQFAQTRRVGSLAVLRRA